MSELGYSITWIGRRLLALAVPLAVAVVMIELGIHCTGWHPLTESDAVWHNPAWVRPCCFILSSLYLAIAAFEVAIWISGSEKVAHHARRLTAIATYASGPTFALIAIYAATSL